MNTKYNFLTPDFFSKTTKKRLRVFYNIGIITMLFFLGKTLFFGEDLIVAISEPYRVNQIIDFQKINNDIYGIVYIDKNTHQRKTLSVLYGQGDPLMVDPWEKFLKHQISVYYDLPPTAQSYANIFPEKYTPGNIYGSYRGKYNQIEIHMPVPNQ